jgi:hypothetical protein
VLGFILSSVFRQRLKPGLIVSWPGYDDVKIRDIFRLSNYDMHFLECQQDFVSGVLSGLLHADRGFGQAGAAILDREMASQLAAPSGSVLAAESISLSQHNPRDRRVQKFCKTLGLCSHALVRHNVGVGTEWIIRPGNGAAIANPDRLPLFGTDAITQVKMLPMRFGFNGVAWLRGCNNSATYETFLDPEADVYDLLIMLSTRRLLLVYDWWYLQMQLAARLAAVHADIAINTFVDELLFTIDGNFAAGNYHVWLSMENFLKQAIAPTAARYTNYQELRYDLKTRSVDGEIALGPGDSFPDECDWALLGRAGGVLWMECLAIAPPKQDASVSAKEYSFNASEAAEIRHILTSDPVQRIIAASSSLSANSPFLRLDETHDGLRAATRRVLPLYCPGRHSAGHPHTDLSCIRAMLKADVVGWRLDYRDLKRRNWREAYGKAMK